MYEMIVHGIELLARQLRCLLRAGSISQRQIGILKSMAQAFATISSQDVQYHIWLPQPRLAPYPEGQAHAGIQYNMEIYEDIV
jgi:hypothetical protein